MEIDCYNKNLNELLNYVKSDTYHFKPSDQNYLTDKIEKLMIEINSRFCHEKSIV